MKKHSKIIKNYTHAKGYTARIIEAERGSRSNCTKRALDDLEAILVSAQGPVPAYMRAELRTAERAVLRALDAQCETANEE